MRKLNKQFIILKFQEVREARALQHGLMSLSTEVTGIAQKARYEITLSGQ